MDKHTLFLLAPGFEADGRRELCLECATVWGVLHYFPAIKEALEIRYQPLGHPRAGLVEMLGEGEWNCPTLVLADGADAGPHATVKTANGMRFLDSARDIAKFFAHACGTPFPRGS